jgi:co-chaperonin GroES (HSP10)
VTGRIDPIDLQPGDHVCFVEHAGAEEEIDGETCLIMRDEEIYAVRR